MLAECLDAAKIPPGVFQMILGKASEIGEEFVSNRLLRKITFTGSTPVGKKLIEGAAKQVKPLSLELGGNFALAIVFDDCDFDRAIEGVLAAKFRNTGQSCIAANRVYVQAGIYDRFMSAFVEPREEDEDRRRACRGRNRHRRTHRPEARSTRPLGQIEDAKRQVERQGARRRASPWKIGGFFLEPTVLENVQADSLCMHEAKRVRSGCTGREIYDGRRSDHPGQYNTVYGLSAYAFTSNIDRMFRIAEKLEAGTIGINDGVPSTSNAPFGGMKESGWGRELGSEGLESFPRDQVHISLGVK